MAQSQRNPKRQKIEPLNYLEMAQAPALKGGVSLLEIPADQVRTGRFEQFVQDGDERQPSCPVDERTPGDETSAATWQRRAVTPITQRRALRPVNVARPAYETTPGDERLASLRQAHLISGKPGQGRSQVRRCVLAQDGHSLGEEAIYQVMWRAGSPESNDPNASRVVRIGAADLGMKVNMAKKNVRQNIARLFEKLSIEVLENFDTMSSQARLYRVFSYKQILERRREAGLEYVVRNKGVVFCSQDGSVILRSPAYETTPGDETPLRPAKPRTRRHSPRRPDLPLQDEGSLAPPTSEEADVAAVSEALNSYWPIDEPAAAQLLRSCRKLRPDARVDEIAFFVAEKVASIRTNRNITNPTGLILATVPKCFIGQTFESFRQRQEARRAHEAAEAQRKAEQMEEFRAQIAEHLKECRAILDDPTSSEKDRIQAERDIRSYSVWYPEIE